MAKSRTKSDVADTIAGVLKRHSSRAPDAIAGDMADLYMNCSDLVSQFDQLLRLEMSTAGHNERSKALVDLVCTVEYLEDVLDDTVEELGTVVHGKLWAQMRKQHKTSRASTKDLAPGRKRKTESD